MATGSKKTTKTSTKSVSKNSAKKATTGQSEAEMKKASASAIALAEDAKNNKPNDVNDPAKPVVTPTPKIVIPPAPAGMDQKVWEQAFTQALAQKTARGTRAAGASGITELTNETAQKLVDAGNIAASIRAGKLGTVLILPTDGQEGCYSLALLQDGKVKQVEPAHVNRVKSPRHLPRALRLAGTWIGEHPESGFVNGPSPKTKEEVMDETAALATEVAKSVVLTPEQVKQVAATGKVMTEEQVSKIGADVSPRNNKRGRK